MAEPQTKRRTLLDDLGDTPRGSAEVRLDVLPPRCKFALRGPDEAIRPIGDVFGLQLPQLLNRFTHDATRRAAMLGPDEWLLLGYEDRDDLAARAAERLTATPHSLVDVGHGFESLRLSGPKAGYALNHGCPLDLSTEGFPAGMATRTVVGKAQATLLRLRPDCFEIEVARSFAPYLFAFLSEASREFVPSAL